MFRHMKVTAYESIVLEFWKQLPVEGGYFCGRSVASLLRFAVPTITNINAHFECKFAVFVHYTVYGMWI